MRRVLILGSTGSIGTQALDLVRANPDRIRVVGLTAGGSNPDLFAQQVEEFGPAVHGLGEQASVDAAAHPCDVVLNGITGAVGLQRHVRFGPVSELPNGRATLPGPFSGDRHVYARTDRGDSVRTGRIVYKRLYRQDGTLVGVYPVAVD